MPPRAEESDIEVLLKRFSEGDQRGSEQLLSLLYSELHALAERMMANQPMGQTLQATALVSEAYLRLASTRSRTWEGRAHLMTVAGQAMRCVLIDHARRRACRGPTPTEAPSALDRILVTYQDRALDLLALDEALERLAEFAPEMAQAVELRFFVGLSTAEAAEILGMPKRTLERRWEATRAWLFEELS
jgi:RNA polymerase sigma factor (TIGR02999 family)